MLCPLCRGKLDFPASGQVVECPHCQGQIQMPFAPPDLFDPAEVSPATSGGSNRTLWVIGGVVTLIAAAVGVLLSGALTPYFLGAASTVQDVQRREMPSAAQGEQALRELIAKESEGRMKLVGFNALDGQERQLLGAMVYELNYKAELEVTKDCTYMIGTELIGSGAGVLTWPYKAEPGAAANARQGKRIGIVGNVNFAEGNAGWRILDVRIAADIGAKGDANRKPDAPRDGSREEPKKAAPH